MAFEKYYHYFDIDPDYIPCINDEVINKNPDIWKKFFPHETFIKLLDNTVSVLQRKQKLSIWVEGAYGTGKSYAVHTLKKLLDASENDTKEYFDTYNLSHDLFNKLQNAKNSGKILTVHRYGSSAINSDQSLCFAIQESIQNALEINNIKNKGNNSLKEAILNWLSDTENKKYFDSLITGPYEDIFNGDTADDVIDSLNSMSDTSLLNLMEKIFKIADERQIKVLSLTTTNIANWIKEIIKSNNLKAIVFIWDEFTEFFENNSRNLTGFQEIVEISETDPFYMVIVTHKSAGLFSDADKDKSKILDRFIKPTCIIELPENMALQLMAVAMRKNDDELLKKEWNKVFEDLYSRTHDSRKTIESDTNIKDAELKGVLPIHPYAALLLKHISSAFDSNQRSMFKFIKDNDGDDTKGFQWFIHNYSPEDDNPLLTIDMLWDFFYEKGKENLSHNIRSILDCYSRSATKHLSDIEQRVLKTILLLQAVSQKVGDSVELFIPNEKNINNAFEGSDIENGAASRCADKLVRDEIIYKKPIGNGKTEYSALINAGDVGATVKLKNEIKSRPTSNLIDEGGLSNTVSFNGALKLRYEIEYVSSNDFDFKIRKLINKASNLENKILSVVCFAKDDDESDLIFKKVKKEIEDNNHNIVFIDASTTPFGKDSHEQYCENMAQSMYYQGKDNNLARQYDNNAKEVLRKWSNRILHGEFLVYYDSCKNGERANNLERLSSILTKIDKDRYPNCLEGNYNATDTMYTPSSLKLGVQCGATQEVKGAFKSSNKATQLENALEGAWNREGKYWIDKPQLLISKIKNHVEKIIEQEFSSNGRVAISKIYGSLKESPFGFMPCNLSAFILGFVLKEYTDGSFNWTDGIMNGVLDVDKLKEMVEEVIKLQITPNSKYREKYIVAMTESEKSFNETTSISFGIPKSLCTSVEQTREQIRNKMKEYSFPIWTLKYVVDKENLKTDKSVIKNVIDLYGGIANNYNLSSNYKDESAIAYEIGDLAIKHTDIPNDLKSLLTKEKCNEGMKTYLKGFNGGELPRLAEKISDNGQYVNAVRKKFDADAANWVWNVELAQQKINEVILEYKIIEKSNDAMNQKNTSFENTINNWCDKCLYIRLSYEYIKDYLEQEPRAFLEILCDLKKANTLLDSQKQKFYNLLVSNTENFKKFYSNQIDLFKQTCEFFLGEFADDEIKEIFESLPTGCFTKEKSEYATTVSEKVEQYKQNSTSAKLKKLWKDKTNTDSPKDWSEKYKMPILCMVNEKEITTAKHAFELLNKSHVDTIGIENAIKYLENATFFDSLESKSERDKAFSKLIIKDYDVVLNNIEEVKNYLTKRMDSSPYDWFGLPEIDKKLKQMAEAKYNQEGCHKALEKIDRMSESDVKRYLKDLIKDDMAVGIAIIKDN
jgi:hypothetical protein